jgi:hypothetical protein
MLYIVSFWLTTTFVMYYQRSERVASRSHATTEDILDRMKQPDRASEEAAHRARVEQAHKAQERLDKAEEAEKKKREREEKVAHRKLAAKERAADKNSRAVLDKLRVQQQKDAQLRMARSYIKENIEKALREREESAPSSTELVVELGWTKKKGAAKCLFCGGEIKFYAFVCPKGGAVACGPCKNELGRCVVIKKGNGDEEGMEDGDGSWIDEKTE